MKKIYGKLRKLFTDILAFFLTLMQGPFPW